METTNNVTLQKLKNQIAVWWLEHRQILDSDLGPCYNYSDELTYQNGLLLKGELIIVPATLRFEMHRILHQAHLGIEKGKHSSGPTWTLKSQT